MIDKMYNIDANLRKLKIKVTQEMIDDLKNMNGLDYDIEKILEELLRREQIKLRNKKIQKIIGGV
jgi:hypothetical protein